MKANFGNHNDTLLMLDETEYQRRLHNAVSRYAALEIEEWQEVCTEDAIAPA